MCRLVTGVIVLALTTGASAAEPDDIAARALARANIPFCSPMTSHKPHIAEWRYDVAVSGEDVTLWGFPCDSGAYNTVWSVILWSENTGHRIASVPVPLFSSGEDGEGFSMTGVVADTRVWGASFDPESGLLRSAHPFRASHDAAVIGYWRLMPPPVMFGLVRYEADLVMDSELILLPVIEFE